MVEIDWEEVRKELETVDFLKTSTLDQRFAKIDSKLVVRRHRKFKSLDVVLDVAVCPV